MESQLKNNDPNRLNSKVFPQITVILTNEGKFDLNSIYQHSLRQLLHQRFRQKEAEDANANARDSKDDHRQIVHDPVGERDEGTEDGREVSDNVYESQPLAANDRGQQFRGVLDRDVRGDVDEQTANDRERGVSKSNGGAGRA